MQESKYRCINVYAPNNEYERVKFISALPSIINDSDEEDTYIETILGGDFNCVMNNALDRKNCNSNQDVGQVDVKNIMDTFELEDVWRRRNPDKLSYTCTWEGRGKSSSIDYWIISKFIDGQTDKVMHTPAPSSDHSAIQINICIDETEWGKWSLEDEYFNTHKPYF